MKNDIELRAGIYSPRALQFPPCPIQLCECMNPNSSDRLVPNLARVVSLVRVRTEWLTRVSLSLLKTLRDDAEQDN